MRHLIKMILVSLMVVILSSMVYARSTRCEVESLRGLKGVNVTVEDLKSDIEADGLRKDSIQTDVELKLRLAGIKVLTEEEQFKEPGYPYLYVNVNSVKSNLAPTYAFSIEISLKQVVLLVRDLKIRVFAAATWRKGSVGIVGEQKVDSIRDGVKDGVDEFINDYLSVNPK